MSIFGCSSDEQFKDEQEESNSSCDCCELTYINQCASCRFASSSVNDWFIYNDNEEW